MNKKLQRLIEFGYIYFDEDDAGETGSGESNSESGKSESGSSETKSGSDSGESKATQQMRKYVYKGQTLELNDAQLDNVVALGLMKAEELQESRSKEETKEEEDKPKEKLSPEQERINKLEKELADLRKDSRESSNDRILNDVNNVVDSYDFPDEARTDILKLILSDVALEMQDKKRPNVKKIATDIASRHAKLMKIDRKTDASGKLSDRDKTKFDGKPGTTTKEDKLPKLGKKAFKNGDLAKRILERARQAHARSTEG